MSEVKLVGVCGDIGSGKSTVARILKRDHGFEEISLAEPLKELAIEIFGLERRHVWGEYPDKAEPLPHVCGADGVPRTARYILEYLGTEAFRTIDPDVWTKLARRRIVECIDPPRGCVDGVENVPDTPPRRVVVPDVRFPNEFEMLRELGGVVWKVVKVGGEAAPRTGHESDAAWRLESHDAFVVACDGDLESLAREVGDALRVGGRRHVELLRRG